MISPSRPSSALTATKPLHYLLYSHLLACELNDFGAHVSAGE